MKNLRKARKAKGITQVELAKLINVTQATYSEYENGKCKPSFDTVIRLCDILGCSADFLLGRNDDALLDGAALPKSEIQEIYEELDAAGRKQLLGYAHALRDGMKNRRKK